MYGEVRYHLHPKAEADILEQKRMLTNSVKAGLITRETAHEQFVEAVAKIIFHARIQSTDDRMIDVTCPDCHREHRMRADVIEYKCPCDSNKTRFAMAEQTGTSRPSLNQQSRELDFEREAC